MDLINLIKKVFSARKEEDSGDIFSIAGNEVVMITDRRIIVYRRDENITGPFIQVPFPTDLNEVSKYSPDSHHFVDPEGESVNGFLSTEPGSVQEEKILGAAGTLRSAFLNDRQEISEKMLKTLITDKFELRVSEASANKTEIKIAKAKNFHKIDLDLGALFGTLSAVSMKVPLKPLCKTDPAPTFYYSRSIRCIVLVTQDSDGKELGAVIPFRFNVKENKKEEADMPENKKKVDAINNIVAEAAAIAQPKVMPPLGVQTGDPKTSVPTPPKDGAPVIPAENAATRDAQIKKDNLEAQAAAAKPVVTPKEEATQIVVDPIPEKEPSEEDLTSSGEEDTTVAENATVDEVVTDSNATKGADLPDGTAPAVSDDDRLVGMMEAFNAGFMSEVRNKVMFLERLVKLQAKLLKKGSACEKIRKENVVLKAENVELKKKNDKFKKAQAALNDALGK